MDTPEKGNQPLKMEKEDNLSDLLRNIDARCQHAPKETENDNLRLPEQAMVGIHQLIELIKAIPFQKPGDELSNWINSEEVIRIMKVSPRTMHTWRRNGTLKCSLIGNKLFYRKTDIEELLKAKFGTSTDQKRKD